MLLNFSSLLSLRALCLAMALTIAGCTPSVKSEAVVPPGPPPVKALLNDVANSGELGSGAESIRTGLTELKATDAAKADPLLKELDELEKLSDPAKIKAKAKLMADKL